MKKIKLAALLALGVMLLQSAAQNGVTISDKIRAANFWMPGRDLDLDGNPDIFLPTHINGDFQKYVNQLKALQITHIRIGGKDYDEDRMFSMGDLAKIINWLRSHGFEVIVQVPIDPIQTISWNATNTASFVAEMNNSSPPRLTRPVEYWAIGNEPDGSYASPYNTNATIAAYTRSCSEAMKAVPGQANIKIIGPTLSFYDFPKYNEFLAPAGTNSNSIMGSGSNGPYIDIVSFNSYPILPSVLQATATARQNIIDHLRSPAQFVAIISTIQAKAASASRTDLKIMVTEANLCSQQDVNNKGAAGVGPGSFLGGQFWAEMQAISMEKGIESIMHWSVVEGTDNDPGEPDWITDIGLIGKEATGTNTANPVLRPSYHHFKWMAQQFHGTFYSLENTPGNNIKAWAARSNDRIAVMIQNQNTQSSGTGYMPVQVRFNTNVQAPGTGTVDLRFNIAAAQSTAAYTGTISNESSVVLNCVGQLGWRFHYTLNDASSNDPGLHLTYFASHRGQVSTYSFKVVRNQVRCHSHLLTCGVPSTTCKELFLI